MKFINPAGILGIAALVAAIGCEKDSRLESSDPPNVERTVIVKEETFVNQPGTVNNSGSVRAPASVLGKVYQLSSSKANTTLQLNGDGSYSIASTDNVPGEAGNYSYVAADNVGTLTLNDQSGKQTNLILRFSSDQTGTFNTSTSGGLEPSEQYSGSFQQITTI